MRHKTIYHLIIITMFFISFTGCGNFDKDLGIVQVPTKSQRPVENNVFSSKFPEMMLQISQDLRYLGSVLLLESTETRISLNTDSGANVTATSYIFGQIDQNNRIAKGVIIRVLVMHGDPSQEIPEIFTKTSKNILESGEMKILEEKYRYDLYTEQALFTQKEKELLANSRVPPCFLVKQLSVRAGLGSKSRVQLLYYEDVSNTCGNRPCGTCLDPKSLTAEQQQVIQGFNDRSYASTRFLKTRTIEDTTSRYVDAEPKMQPAPAGQIQPKPAPVERAQPAPVERIRPAPVAAPAAPAEKAPPAPLVVPVPPVEKAPPVAVPVKADAVEKRLEALKRIYERNLISKEDYEKKKAEILNEL
jgi:hypothetical protein